MLLAAASLFLALVGAGRLLVLNPDPPVVSSVIMIAIALALAPHWLRAIRRGDLRTAPSNPNR